METLVKVENNQVVVSSRQIAESFEKEHRNIIRDIKGLLKIEHTRNMFLETTYIHEQNKQEYKEYLMNRDGFSLLVMGFTGQKALEWKLKYIKAFNTMEEQLRAKTTKEIDAIKAEKIAMIKRSVKIKEAALWEKLARGGNDTFKQICRTYAANTLAEKEILALPKVQKKTYTATEIGEILGISANKVGKIANTYGLKTKEYGEYFHDKSRYSNKEVESFRYYEDAIEVLRGYLG